MQRASCFWVCSEFVIWKHSTGVLAPTCFSRVFPVGLMLSYVAGSSSTDLNVWEWQVHVSQEVCHSATAASVVWLLALDFIFTRCVSPWPRISMLDVVQTEGLSDTGKVRTCETRFQLTFRPQKWNLKAHMWYQLSPFPLPPLDSERGNFVGRVVYVAWISISCMLPPDESSFTLGKEFRFSSTAAISL